MQIDKTLDLAKKTSPEIYGKTCASCQADLDWQYFRRDSSMRDGHVAQCLECESAPRLSTAEHTSRLRELNDSSHAVRAQRWANQDDYRNEMARIGRPMHYTDFLAKIKKLVPSLYITEGRIEGDLAVFQTFPGPQSKLEGRDYAYMWYVPKITMPEFSIYEFDARDVPVREKIRGWRTPLLRLVKAGLISEQQADKTFGKALLGEASTVWYRKLQEHRNRSISA